MIKTIILSGITNPSKYAGSGIAYYFKFTLPEDAADELFRKFHKTPDGNDRKKLLAVQTIGFSCENLPYCRRPAYFPSSVLSSACLAARNSLR